MVVLVFSDDEGAWTACQDRSIARVDELNVAEEDGAVAGGELVASLEELLEEVFSGTTAADGSAVIDNPLLAIFMAPFPDEDGKDEVADTRFGVNVADEETIAMVEEMAEMAGARTAELATSLFTSLPDGATGRMSLFTLEACSALAAIISLSDKYHFPCVMSA